MLSLFKTQEQKLMETMISLDKYRKVADEARHTYVQGMLEIKQSTPENRPMLCAALTEVINKYSIGIPIWKKTWEPQETDNFTSQIRGYVETIKEYNT